MRKDYYATTSYVPKKKIVTQEIVIDELPGGFGQTAQKLAEPIVIQKTVYQLDKNKLSEQLCGISDVELENKIIGTVKCTRCGKPHKRSFGKSYFFCPTCISQVKNTEDMFGEDHV